VRHARTIAGKLNYASKEIVVIFNRLARHGPDSNLERAIPLSKTLQGKAAMKTQITLILTNSL